MDGTRRPHHYRAQGSTDGAEMLGHRQRLPSEEEEGRVSHPPGNEVRTKGGSQQTEEGRSQQGLTTTKRSGW